MRHTKIHKSNRHKKFKNTNDLNDDNFVESHVKQKNLNEQKVSRKWLEIMEMNNKLKNRSNRRKKKVKDDLIRVNCETEPFEKGMTRSDKPLPQVVEQGLYESEYHFLQRLGKLSAKAKAEATIEDRFDVDFNNEKSAENDLKDNDEEGKETDNEVSNKKKLKRKQKNIKKKERKRKKYKKIKTNEFTQHFKDEVKFGEIVSEPPHLSQFKFKKSKLIKTKTKLL